MKHRLLLPLLGYFTRVTEALRQKSVELGPQTVAGVLDESLRTLERAGIEALVVGGVATAVYGRAAPVRDIDLMVREKDASAALEALASAGFDTKVEYPDWLYKAFKSDVLIDLIFKGAGEIGADDEMFERSRLTNVMQTSIRLVAPEDHVIMLTAAAREGTVYWHNAEGVVENTELDWKYLLRRARRRPGQVLALLLFCRSSGMDVPLLVIHDLYERVMASERESDGDDAASEGS